MICCALCDLVLYTGPDRADRATERLQGSGSALRLGYGRDLTAGAGVTRNTTKERECAAIYSADLDKQSLLSILKCDGLEVAALTFRRPPLKITPTRRKAEPLGAYTIRVDQDK
jgi:hypothetical protein